MRRWDEKSKDSRDGDTSCGAIGTKNLSVTSRLTPRTAFGIPTREAYDIKRLGK